MMLNYNLPEGVTLTKEQVKIVEETVNHLKKLLDIDKLVKWLEINHCISEIILFGSHINGRHKESSDLDIIFHSDFQGEWWDNTYCKEAYEELMAVCDSFKKYLKKEVVIDAMLSRSSEGDYWGVINRDIKYINTDEYPVASWDYSDFPYSFRIDKDGLSFTVHHEDLQYVFEDGRFMSFYV